MGFGYSPTMTPGGVPADWDGRTSPFATTHWTVVLAAGRGDSPQATEALEELCRTYWYPVYAFVRRHGHDPTDAQDLAQAFFADLLRRGSLSTARPERGRFRWFLLASVRHFLANEWDKAKAQKRGGDVKFISLEQAAAEKRYAQEPSHDLTPERIYERSWGVTVIQQVRHRLREEFQGLDKGPRFELLDRLLPGEERQLTTAEVASRLGLTEGSVRSEVHRLKRRFGEMLRAEVAHTVAAPADIDGEIQHLMEVVSG